MNNNNALRKTLIILLVIVTVIVVIFVLRSIMVNTPSKSDVSNQQEPTVEIKPAFDLVQEDKFGLVTYTPEGFSENSITVPLGGVLQIDNQTDSEIMFTIVKEGYSASVIAEPLNSTFSPVFSEKGEYTLSIFEGIDIESRFKSTVIVK